MTTNKADKERVVTFTLTVEYRGEEFSPDIIMDAIPQLIEQARGYGSPVKAVVKGMPSEWEVPV